ncbi:MAG: trehalose-phosphatase [Ramlibacter sp.]|jgi:trehalose 6-phosphate phosphatase
MTFSDVLCPSCALFLDFDGTLVDIASHPQAVVVPPGLPDTLARLKDLLAGAVAVVSGRPIQEIDHFLAPLVLSAAGVHGAERRRADGTLAWQAVRPMRTVQVAAQALAREHPALVVEAKRGSIALHYRQAPQLQALCLATMQAAVERSPGLTLLCGKMVVEAKPGCATKSQAIEAFLKEAPFAGRTPVFVGDDVTDESGFDSVQRRGGIGVKVGEGPSVARERVAHPGAMREAMERAIARHAQCRPGGRAP